MGELTSKISVRALLKASGGKAPTITELTSYNAGSTHVSVSVRRRVVVGALSVLVVVVGWWCWYCPAALEGEGDNVGFWCIHE